MLAGDDEEPQQDFEEESDEVQLPDPVFLFIPYAYEHHLLIACLLACARDNAALTVLFFPTNLGSVGV